MTKNIWDELFGEFLDDGVISSFKNKASDKIDDMFNKHKEDPGFLNTGINDILDVINGIINTLDEEAIGKIKLAIKNGGGVLNLAKRAWNLEEQHTDCLTFEEVITWIKTNIDINKHSAGCLFVKNKIIGESEFHICFLDKEENPLLEGKSKHIIYYSKTCDKALKQQLGNENMLVIK